VRLTGVPIRVGLWISSVFMVQTELYFSDQVQVGLLGQQPFFEILGAAFVNFPRSKYGRRFALFASR